MGSGLVRKLQKENHSTLLLRSHQELDLLDQKAVHDFFHQEKPEYVFLAAAKVGGIFANKTYPADFLYENLVITSNIVHAAAESGVQKLLFLGSSCIYPRLAPQPMREDALLTGPLEPTNEGYALAKIAGLKLCEMYQRQYGKRFISAMPTNLYGPHDSFHAENSHVVPGMLRRFHEAKQARTPEVTIWGTGKAMRELLYVDDVADALYLMMQTYEKPEFVNIGTGEDVTILELAKLVQEVAGYEGEILTDPSKPDGTPRKVVDVIRCHNLGWKHRYTLKEGLTRTYQWALDNNAFGVHP